MVAVKTVMSPLVKYPLTIGTEILKPTENYQSISISWKWTWYENLLWESTTAGKESRKLAVVTVIIVI